MSALTPLAKSRVLILGASGGLGHAVVQALTALPAEHRPAQLYLCGRSKEKLTSLCTKAVQAGIDAKLCVFDLRDAARSEAELQAAFSAGLDKVLILSGISLTAGQDGLEDHYELERGFRVNAVEPCRVILSSAAALAAGGQVIAVSSLAARLPLPSSPVYAASKGALSLYAKAMQPHFKRRGLYLSLVEPGFFVSPMSERYQGAKAGLVSAEFAAKKILAVMQSGQALTAFPRCLHWGSALLLRLPALVQFYFLQRYFRFAVLPDAERQAVSGGEVHHVS